MALATPPLGWTDSVVNTGYPASAYAGPQISGDRVVWMGGSPQQIFTWEVGDTAPTILTSNPSDHTQAVVSGDRVGWSGVVGSYSQIFTWREGDAAATTLTTDPHLHQSPQVSGDRVMWTGTDDAAVYQVYARDMNDSSVQTLTAGTHHIFQCWLSSGLAAWHGQDDLNRYQIYTCTPGGSEVTTLMPGSVWGVSGNRLACESYVSGYEQVYTWQNGDAQLTTLTVDLSGLHGDVGVSGDRVVWRTEVQGSGYQIFTWTPASGVTSVPGGAIVCQSLAVGGDRLVWLKYNYSVPHWQLFTWKVGDSEPTWISDNANQDSNPQVDGDRIVWAGMSNDIHVASFAATFALRYLAGSGGTLSGVTFQTVAYGTSGAAVTAVPSTGYRFFRWSDGSTANPRTDSGVVSDRTATAQFTKIIKAASIARTPNKSTVIYTRKHGVAKFALSAVIKGWGSKAVTSHYVYLQSSNNGRSWSSGYKLKTSSTGKASKDFKITTKRVCYYRWYVPAKSEMCLKTYSNSTKVTVK